MKSEILGIASDNYITLADYIKKNGIRKGYDYSSNYSVRYYLDYNGYRYSCNIRFKEYNSLFIYGFFLEEDCIVGIVMNIRR